MNGLFIIKLMKENNFIRAVLFNSISKYMGIIIKLLFTMILAHILSPKDYGILKIFYTFSSFVSEKI